MTGDASAMRQLAEGYAEELKEIVEKNSELQTSNTELVPFFPCKIFSFKILLCVSSLVAYGAYWPKTQRPSSSM